MPQETQASYANLFQGVNLSSNGSHLTPAVEGQPKEVRLEQWHTNFSLCTYSLDVVNTVSDSIGAQASFLGLFGSSFSQSYASSLALSELSTAIIFTRVYREKDISAQSVRFTQEALEFVKIPDLTAKRFTATYGHAYVSKEIHGGILTFSIKLTSSSREDAKELKRKIEAEGIFKNLKAGFDVSKELTKATRELNSTFVFDSSVKGVFEEIESKKPVQNPSRLEDIPSFITAAMNCTLTTSVVLEEMIQDYHSIPNAPNQISWGVLDNLAGNIKCIYGISEIKKGWIVLQQELKSKLKAYELIQDVYRYYGYRDYAAALEERVKAINNDLSVAADRIYDFFEDPNGVPSYPELEEFVSLDFPIPTLNPSLPMVASLGHRRAGESFDVLESLGMSVKSLLLDKSHLEKMALVLSNVSDSDVLSGLKVSTRGTDTPFREGVGKDKSDQRYRTSFEFSSPGTGITDITGITSNDSEMIKYLRICEGKDYLETGKRPSGQEVKPLESFDASQPRILVNITGGVLTKNSSKVISNLNFIFVHLKPPL